MVVMPARQAPLTAMDDEVSPRRELVAKVLRYTAGSVVAAVCSEVTFLLLYGPVHAAPAVASGLGWLAGAVPNYWLNRSWTWRRQGRPSLMGEVIPYVAIVLVTLVLAVVATSAADRLLVQGNVSADVRVVLVGGAFLAVYCVMFLLRFFLLDRLFRRSAFSSPIVTDPPQPGSPL
jgi:putative flippase GtrA